MDFCNFERLGERWAGKHSGKLEDFSHENLCL